MSDKDIEEAHHLLTGLQAAEFISLDDVLKVRKLLQELQAGRDQLRALRSDPPKKKRKVKPGAGAWWLEEENQVEGSSNIRAARYVYASTHAGPGEVMEVAFQGGGVYRYLDVPHRIYMDFLGAESKGSFFNREIKTRFECEKIQ